MYINAILSSMGAWGLLHQEHRQVWRELELALSHLSGRNTNPDDEHAVAHLHQDLNHQLELLDWQLGMQLRLDTGNRTFYTIDFLKEKIAGKLILGKQALSQSVHTSKRELKQFLLDYIARNNENPRPFVWTKGPEKLQRIIEATKEYQATHPRKPRKRRRKANRRTANNIKK